MIVKNHKPIEEIFVTEGMPSVTYVERDHGKYEKKLIDAINSKGTLCILTGPSKTGKTSLYTKVLKDNGKTAKKIRCRKELTAKQFWLCVLEEFNCEIRTKTDKQKTTGKKVGVKFGLSGGYKEICRNGSTFKTIVTHPSPKHVLPYLTDINTILVVEDFHYLRPNVQKNIFQQWKLFVDEGISILLIETAHHAADIRYMNSNMVGRVEHISFPTWNVSELSIIAKQGFDYLKVEIPDEYSKKIAIESVGLPMITQSVCRELMLKYGIKVRQRNKIIIPADTVTFDHALHDVAAKRYNFLYDSDYSLLTTDPKIKGVDPRINEFILTAFTEGPINYSLHIKEIKMRIKNMCNIQINKLEQAIKALNKLQFKLKHIENGEELFEFNKDVFYILERTFLYFLRWRIAKHKELLQTRTQFSKDI